METTTEKLDLRKILRGHEGMPVYSPVFGPGTFVGFDDRLFSVSVRPEAGGEEDLCCFDTNGKYLDAPQGECLLFPSREERDWGKWAAEHTTEPWRANPWGMYYYIDFSTFKAIYEVDNDDTACQLHYELGNYFRTREEAEAKIAEISAILHAPKADSDNG